MPDKAPETGQVTHRAFGIDGPDEAGSRALEFSFASEDPYRRWFGYEVLGLQEGEVDLSRLNDRAPMLVDHRNEVGSQIGVVEKAWLDDGKGRCQVKLFDGYTEQGAKASGFLDILRQGSGGKISVGYTVDKYEKLDDEIDGEPVFRAVKWTPMEVSGVAVPADDTVGVGKSQPIATENSERGDRKMSEAAQAAETAPAQPVAETKAAAPEAQPAPAPAVVVDNGKVRADILAIAESDAYAPYGAEKLAMRELAKPSPSVEGFRAALMDEMVKGSQPSQGERLYGRIGVEESRKFNFGNLRRALVHRLNGNHKEAEKVGGFEMEFGAEFTRELGAGGLKEAKGFSIPIGAFAMEAVRSGAILNRVSSVNPNAETSGTTVGQGELRGTDHRADLFVEALYNASAFLGNGATVMEGLQGNLEFPREGTVIQASWRQENEEHRPTDPTFSDTMMTPKRLSAGVVRTRQLLLQSDPSIDRILMRELTEGMAEAEDGAIIAADGTGNAPTGIMKEMADLSGTPQTVKPAYSNANSGFAPNHDFIVSFETLLNEKNVNTRRARYFVNAKTMGKLKTTKIDAGSGIFLVDGRAPGMLNSYPVVVSNQLRSDRSRGTGRNFSEMIFCDPAEVLVGHWGGASISIDPYSQLDRDNVRMFVHRYVDFAVRRRESFAVNQALDV